MDACTRVWCLWPLGEDSAQPVAKIVTVQWPAWCSVPNADVPVEPARPRTRSARLAAGCRLEIHVWPQAVSPCAPRPTRPPYAIRSLQLRSCRWFPFVESSRSACSRNWCMVQPPCRMRAQCCRLVRYEVTRNKHKGGRPQAARPCVPRPASGTARAGRAGEGEVEGRAPGPRVSDALST